MLSLKHSHNLFEQIKLANITELELIESLCSTLILTLNNKRKIMLKSSRSLNNWFNSIQVNNIYQKLSEKLRLKFFRPAMKN